MSVVSCSFSVSLAAVLFSVPIPPPGSRASWLPPRPAFHAQRAEEIVQVKDWASIYVRTGLDIRSTQRPQARLVIWWQGLQFMPRSVIQGYDYKQQNPQQSFSCELSGESALSINDRFVFKLFPRRPSHSELWRSLPFFYLKGRRSDSQFTHRPFAAHPRKKKIPS